MDGAISKPPYSIPQLIAKAIRRAPDSPLTSRSISDWIADTFEFYRARKQDGTLLRDIRNQLSRSIAFEKRERLIDGAVPETYWVLNPDFEQKLAVEEPKEPGHLSEQRKTTKTAEEKFREEPKWGPHRNKASHVINDPPALRNRSNRTQGEDDTSVMKGLPVRQWRQTETLIGPPPEAQTQLGKQRWPEWPMPRDSHLLPEVSQQLLRAARAGRLYRPLTPPNDDDEKDNPPEEDEVKEVQQGFVAKKWSVVPRHLEEPEPEHLAKRRKGLPAPWSGEPLPSIAPQTAFRKTKVRKLDSEGNAHIYEVLAPEGQKIEGEVIEEDETLKSAPIETAVVPGTVVEGVGIVNAEGLVVATDLLQPNLTRKPPLPPRRKPKRGPGRGKKRVKIAGASVGGLGTSSNSLNMAGTTAADAASSGSAVPSNQGDTPMLDAQDGEEDESGLDGEDGDEDGREEGELSPTPEPDGEETRPLDVNPPTSEPPAIISTLSASKLDAASQRDVSSSPEMPLATKTSPSLHTSTAGGLESDTVAEALPATSELTQPTDVVFSDGETDLFGSLEAALGKDGKESVKDTAKE
ncbi:hypothetical protein FKW77_010540 [Venturia effusa]|uniref:Fork-head domain-containing protein n=1 Tax=Venturia effusa TaxID=50376 RepID=A0A517KXU1_9PEZI|nr:hypothetical protein FKW77_010540 [Venturia effusa]